MVDRVLHGHAAAQRPADEVNPARAASLGTGQQLGQVVGEVADAAGRIHWRGLRMPEPPQVRGDAAIAVRESGQVLLEEPGGRQVAMHEHDDGPIAAAAEQDVMAQPGGADLADPDPAGLVRSGH